MLPNKAAGDSLGTAYVVDRTNGQVNKNVQVSLYSKEHMHAKYTCVDGVYSVFGSFNFDRWSARRNLEVAVGVFDRGVGARVEEIFENRKQQATIVTKDEWYLNHWGARAVCAVAYLVLKLSGKNIVDGMDSYRRDWARKKDVIVKNIDEDLALRIATGF
jgi:cardiolipin synthase